MSSATEAGALAHGEGRERGRSGAETWVRRGCALLVAGVAAYASYEHQRTFAVAGGADATSAILWPLSVDGLLVLATVGLLAPAHRKRRRARVVVWVAFLLGIVVSLAANIASAPTMAWQPVLVAGWPPLALLLAVELLTHARREPAVSVPVEPAPAASRVERPVAVVDSGAGARAATGTHGHDRRNAERVMWEHLQRELARGRIPTGAELDRVAKTNNYGRRLLRAWRRKGLITMESVAQDDPGGGVSVGAVAVGGSGSQPSR